MKWNDYAKVGAKLQSAFLNHKYNEVVTDCSFVFDILNKLSIDEGYTLVSVNQKEWMGGHCTLCAVPKDVVETESLPPMQWPQCEEFSIWEHLAIDHSPMGAWQACILDFAVAWMPLYWHGGYYRKKYVFSANTLRSLCVDDRGVPNMPTHPKAMLYSKFMEDTRIPPTVEMNGDSAVMTHCYWSEWEGLVRWTDQCTFSADGKLLFDHSEDAEEKAKEVLFEYNCGILF